MTKKKAFFWTRKEIKVSRGESFSRIDFKIHERIILDHISSNSYYDCYWYDYTWRHHLFEDLELGRDFDLDFIDFSLPEFNVLDSFDSIGSSLDGGFGGNGGDGGRDGGGGGD